MVKEAISPSRRGRPPKAKSEKGVSRSPARSPAREASRSTKITRSSMLPKSRVKSPVKKTSKVSPKPSPKKPRTKSPGRVKSKPAPPKVISISDSESESETSTSSVATRSRQTSKDPTYDIVNNLRSRAQKEPVERPSLLRSNYEPVKKFIEFSDEDDEPITVKPPPKSTKRGLNIVAIVITLCYCLVELILTYMLPLLCNEMNCGFRWPSRKDIDRIIGSFDVSVFLSFAAFVLFNGILSIIPFGGRKYGSLVPLDGNFKYVLNGFFSLILQIAILISLEVYHIPVSMHIVNNYFKLITAAVVLSFVLGIILFAKALYINKVKYAAANGISVLDKFIMGGEINPRFGPMDVKFVTVRTCIIGAILFTLCVLYQSMEMISTPPIDPKVAVTASAWTVDLIQSIRIRPTLFVLSTFIVIYFCDQFIFESGLLSMMEFKTIPWGFLKCNEFLAGIFLYCMVPKYVYDYNVELPSWQLGLCTCQFLIGYVIYRGANSQKHAFRENPYSPLCSKYESIPTTTGKKLLCSGYWGVVRHPNYLGDILLNASFVPFVWGTPAMILYIFMFGHLMVRAILDNKHCKVRYGAAWDRYCQRVPDLIIPKVF